MSFRGIDIRETGDRLLFRALLQDSAGTIVTGGSTSLNLYELQSDGTLKSYDWNDHTFKSTTLSTEGQAMAHRAGNNGSTNTGIWSYALTTLTGFTAGCIYFAHVANSGASPAVQVREFQFGSGVLADVLLWKGSVPASLVDTDKLPASIQHDALSLSTFDPATAAVDGVSYELVHKALMAVLFGEVVISGNQAEFKARDGSTTVVTVTYGTANGERTASVIA